MSPVPVLGDDRFLGYQLLPLQVIPQPARYVVSYQLKVLLYLLLGPRSRDHGGYGRVRQDELQRGRPERDVMACAHRIYLSRLLHQGRIHESGARPSAVPEVRSQDAVAEGSARDYAYSLFQAVWEELLVRALVEQSVLPCLKEAVEITFLCEP